MIAEKEVECETAHWKSVTLKIRLNEANTQTKERATG